MHSLRSLWMVVSHGAAEITKLGLWGNYTIPKDNPYIDDKELQPEIWALGKRNPWRCSSDSARPSYFMCADTGQVDQTNEHEELNNLKLLQDIKIVLASQFGMMGIAFHPKFSQNGRFFASFNCDKQSWAGYAGRWSCNSEVDYDPSKLPNDSGTRPCQFQTVIAKFTANGTASQSSEVIFSL
ncbi:HIPL1 protein [Capsicum baccatum]|uniref:HIPL1 protein n=1 Tax=Capsicum baccatum TaxID=33114 RepID=A0A2G2UYE7_CAPBA|nr:HIPL1 protein [Capsicum baccatum]